jgi:hypothetical protein
MVNDMVIKITQKAFERKLSWKVKVKISLYLFLTVHKTMKAYWGNGSTASRILNLDTRWK